MIKIKKYYALVNQGSEATITIYGDITSWDWYESDVSSYTLSKELDTIEADVINVYINSYGGEVAEGLAIYNALKRHKAKIKTFCDGFACSIASVIFMAGDERIMSSASLLMIHNAWTYTYGNANDLRKQADDLDTITKASMHAYLASVNITEKELKQMLDDETWIEPYDALEKGFATGVINDKTSNNPNQSIKKEFMSSTIENFKKRQALAKEELQKQQEELQKEPTPEPTPEEPKQSNILNMLERMGK